MGALSDAANDRSSPPWGTLYFSERGKSSGYVEDLRPFGRRLTLSFAPFSFILQKCVYKLQLCTIEADSGELADRMNVIYAVPRCLYDGIETSPRTYSVHFDFSVCRAVYKFRRFVSSLLRVAELDDLGRIDLVSMYREL